MVFTLQIKENYGMPSPFRRISELWEMKTKISLAVTVLLMTAFARTGLAQELDPNLVQLIDWMTGEFDSSEQADRDTAYVNITLKMTRVWKDKPNGAWIYVEQAEASKPDEPYRQRMYFLSNITDDEYSCDIYTLPEPEKYVGAPPKPDDLTLFDLNHLSGCTVVIFYDGFQYGGQTRTGACKSKREDTAYTTSEVTILSSELKSWDRGFDADGNHVWGPEKGPYIFKKR